MDFERSKSVPACQNAGDCPKVTVASETVFMRTRSSIVEFAGIFHMFRS